MATKKDFLKKRGIAAKENLPNYYTSLILCASNSFSNQTSSVKVIRSKMNKWRLVEFNNDDSKEFTGVRIRGMNNSNIVKCSSGKGYQMISGFKRIKDKPVFYESWDAFVNLSENWDQERLDKKATSKVLFLDNKNQIIGNVDLDTVDIGIQQLLCIRDIFSKKRANSIIIGKNFPEARIKPSNEEKLEAVKLREMANNMHVNIKDQLILSDDAYYSFAENEYQI